MFYKTKSTSKSKQFMFLDSSFRPCWHSPGSMAADPAAPVRSDFAPPV